MRKEEDSRPTTAALHGLVVRRLRALPKCVNLLQRSDVHLCIHYNNGVDAHTLLARLDIAGRIKDL